MRPLRWSVGVCLLSEYDADGYLGIQVDAFGEQDSGLQPIETLYPYGFFGRPSDPDSRGCTVLYAHQGDHGYLIPLSDPRTSEKWPQLPKGGSGQGASDGSFASFNPDTHTWTLYVPYEFDSSGTATKAHVVTVGRDGNDKPLIELASGEGPAITILERTTTLSNAPGNAWIKLSDSGIELVGPVKAHGGVDAGGTASVPLAKATELVTWAALVNAALNTLGVPVAPLSPTVVTALTKGA